MDETILQGGNSSQVLKKGDTVRKQQGFWTPTIQRLLTHIRNNGFASGPEFLGIDEQNREILTFIEGETGFFSFIHKQHVIRSVARLLKLYHDSTEGFESGLADNWQLTLPVGSGEKIVICHNDFAPYNIVFDNDLPIGIIDFENACPGNPVWDIAMTAYWFVPLSFSKLDTNSSETIIERASNLKLFCQQYGYSDYEQVIKYTLRRLQILCDTIILRSESGNENFKRMINDGHLDFYKNEIKSLLGVEEQLLLSLKMII